MQHQKTGLGKYGFFLLIIGMLYAITSYNPLHTCVAIAAIFLLVKLTWRKMEMPIIFIAMMTQYLAITVKVFYANYNDLPLDDPSLHRYPEYINEAYYWALGGLLAIALGIGVVMRNFNYNLTESMLNLSLNLNFKKLRLLYIILAITYPIVFRLSFSLGGFQQPISKLLEFKWAIFFLFMLTAFYRKDVKSFLIIFVAELLFSFTGFFSGFKDYFIVLIIGLIIIYGRNIKITNLIPMSLALSIGLYILIVWQYIKPTYRTFLNEGQSTQVSAKGAGESLLTLYDLTNSIDSKAINEGFEMTVDRLSYIDFLSATMRNVPINVTHTNGALWMGALERVLKPRIFFPDKTTIDDSEKTKLYTGEEYMGAEEGVSVSLGYFAESYVDFGRFGMVSVLFAFGLIIGSIYKFVLSKSEDILIGSALSIPLFFVIFNYEKALDKIFGALLMYFIMYILLKKFLLQPTLRFLKKDKVSDV